MLKSLEIVNKHIKFIDDHSTQIKGTPVMINELETIKKDLVKYSNVMFFLKDLFTLLYVGYEFEEYSQNDNYFIREYGPSSGYLITEDLYLVLKQLEKLVGDNHD